MTTITFFAFSFAFVFVNDGSGSGINEYKRELLDSLTVIAYESLRLAKKEVPKAKFALSEIDYSNILFVESKRVKKLKSSAFS